MGAETDGAEACATSVSSLFARSTSFFASSASIFSWISFALLKMPCVCSEQTKQRRVVAARCAFERWRVSAHGQ